MKQALFSVFFIVFLTSFTSCKSEDKKPTQSVTISSDQIRAEDLSFGRDGKSKARITIKTVHGNIAFALYPKSAPNTVTRIIQLAKSGFYDGLTFHRVISNFVAQGGDPNGTGTGGSGQKLKAEFNDIPHVKGTVAMARSADPDSADSQFYIALATLKHLDNKYTVFGHVVEGIELIDKIQKGDKMLTVTFSK